MPMSAKLRFVAARLKMEAANPSHAVEAELRGLVRSQAGAWERGDTFSALWPVRPEEEVRDLAPPRRGGIEIDGVVRRAVFNPQPLWAGVVFVKQMALRGGHDFIAARDEHRQRAVAGAQRRHIVPAVREQQLHG